MVRMQISKYIFGSGESEGGRGIRCAKTGFVDRKRRHREQRPYSD
jgi:hypothetical protein